MRIDVNVIKESVSLLSKFIGAKIHRVNFLTSTFFTLTTSYSRDEEIVIDMNNYNPIIYIDKVDSNSNVKTTQFLDKLKLVLTNAYILDISLVNEDKVILFKLVRKNQYYEQETRLVYFELISYHPNIIICDESNKIINALKLIDLTNRRPVMINTTYLPPEKLSSTATNGNLSLNEVLESIKKENQNITLKSLQEKRKEVYKFLQNKKKSLTKKIDKLSLELDKANNYQYYKDLADSLMVDKDNIVDYKYEYNGETYLLDKTKSINENINSLYKRYKKNKNAISHIDEQIKIAKEQEQYFTSLINTIYELDDEEYIDVLNEFSLSKNKANKKKQNVKRLNEIELDGFRYIYGKNAIQNDFLTFKVASKSDHWFHLENYHGHHLIIKSDKKVSKKEIELAAKIIVMLSNKNDGVVIHTTKENCKRGKQKGQVYLSNYETIKVNVDSFDLLKLSKKVYFKD